MIVFDLRCDGGHRFEGWFASSGDYAAQQERGLLACPQCGSSEVGKAPMAPAVLVKGNQRADELKGPRPDAPVSNAPIPHEVLQAMHALAAAQSKALENSRWVGDGFAEESRAMHYGEKDLEVIHGKATLAEAKSLLEEGISVAPLPFPVAEPDKLN